MRRRRSVLLHVLIMLGLVLSSLAIPLTVTTQASGARVTAPAAAIPAEAHQPRRDRKLAKRTHQRTHERTQADRKRDRTQKDRKQDHKQDRKQDRKKPGQTAEVSRVGDWQEFCDGPDSIRLAASDSCTHGPDPAPPGFTIEQPVQPLTPQAAAAESAAIACDGDGQSGYRVQVLYVRGSNVSSRFTPSLASSIRGWAGQADTIFQSSATATGGTRSLRFVQDPTNCQPTVTEVVVSPAGDGVFNTTISELKSLGYNRTDRIYLAFVDTTAAGICGIGTIWQDDRASGAANWNNSGPSYARVDAWCWNGAIAAHELMHNLGGVQLSAPNTSGGYHCIDEYDVMCYSDSPNYPSTRKDCPNVAARTTQFDCGHQDYYHTSPPAGTYLANYWNPANNRFLIGTAAPSPPPPPPPDPPPPTDDSTDPSPNDKKDKKDKGKSQKHNGKKHNSKNHKKRH